MPTPELNKVLDRIYSKENAKALIQLSSPLLIELVNFSTNLLGRCQCFARNGENIDIAPIILFQHIIEIADGIEVLLSNVCCNAAIPNIRALFEAINSLEYIVEKDFEQRSLSWLCCYLLNRKNDLEKYDATTQKGKDLEKAYFDQFNIDNILTNSGLSIDPDLAEINLILASPQIAFYVDEYKAIKRREKKSPNWFHFFSGPQNRRDLSTHLKHSAEYSLLYGKWSSIAHATNLHDYFTSTAQGQSAFWSIRNPESFKDIAVFTALFFIRAIRVMKEKYRNEEDLSTWYKTEIKPKLDALYNSVIKIVPVDV